MSQNGLACDISRKEGSKWSDTLNHATLRSRSHDDGSYGLAGNTYFRGD